MKQKTYSRQISSSWKVKKQPLLRGSQDTNKIPNVLVDLMFEVRYLGGRKRGFCPQPAQMQETRLPTAESRWRTHHTHSARLFGGIICGFILYYTPRQNFIQESRCPSVTSPASHYASVRAHWPTATRPWSEASRWRHSSHCGGVKGEDWITPNFYSHFYSAPLWEKQSDIKKHKNFFSLRAQRCGPLVRNTALPAGLGAPAPEHSHVLFVQALIGQRGEVCQHEKWFPPWQETCYTSSRLFEKNMFFPLCI